MEGHCEECGARSSLISETLSLCGPCIKECFPRLRPEIAAIHSKGRERFGLPGAPPRAEGGVLCPLCRNRCRIPEGERGFCGLRRVQGEKLVHEGGTPRRGVYDWYHDPLPTNCVASWVCPAGTDSGGELFSTRLGPEYGYKNLAVFYRSCSFDCLFCQNWHFRERASGRGGSAEELARKADALTNCICFFGGDPSTQLPHALAAAHMALKGRKRGPLRICWETNGNIPPKLLRQVAELSLKSGGCVKFDLKAWSPALHYALTGISNEATLENARFMAELAKERPEPPLFVASTLLLPGYVDEEEVGAIASFLARLNPEIPYSLLAFHPQFEMADLPITSRSQAERCHRAATEAGLRRVRLGNTHLLGLGG